MISQLFSLVSKNRFLYNVLKPLANRLQDIGFWDLPIILTRYKQFRILPMYRNIIGRKDTKEIEKYRNIHHGKRIFIISTGPSLREEDIKKLEDEITIGVNGAISLYEKIGWKPTYYCVGDPLVIKNYKGQIINAKLQNVFYALSLKEYESQMNFQPIYYDEYLKGYYRTTYNKKVDRFMQISSDVYKKGIYVGGRSIATYAFQLALYMGAREIYLYGQDCDYSGKAHFNEKTMGGSIKPSHQEEFINTMFAFYRKAKSYCETRGIHVYNATRGGKLEVFERVDLEKIL